MVNFVRIFRNNEYVVLPLQDFLNVNCAQLPEGWSGISNWINRIFEIKNEEDRDVLSREIQVEYFDIVKVRDAYTRLKNEYADFDEDILKYISFLFGTSYFLKIGNPTIDEWLNAVDINRPFKKRVDSDYGFSFVDALGYNFGQNAIRKKLLSTLHWISSQGGS